jgi:hypothetical protein
MAMREVLAASSLVDGVNMREVLAASSLADGAAMREVAAASSASASSRGVTKSVGAVANSPHALATAGWLPSEAEACPERCASLGTEPSFIVGGGASTDGTAASGDGVFARTGVVAGEGAGAFWLGRSDGGTMYGLGVASRAPEMPPSRKLAGGRRGRAAG